MNKKHFFDKHYKRLVTEGVLRSAIYGSLAGFGIIFILSLLYWIFALGGILLSIGIGILTGITVGVLLYVFKYAPTDTAVARRIDRQGLEERMITMLELKDDDSFIAGLQRNDATSKLESVPEKSIRYGLSTLSIILSSALLSASICFVCFGFLAKSGKMPYGKDIFASEVSDGTFSVIYESGTGGTIRGESNQRVAEGESTSPVRALASDGWIFIGWDDGEKSPERYENNVTKDVKIKAVFEKIDNNDDSEDETDSADDLPFGSANNESGGGGADEVGGDNPTDGDQGNGDAKWQNKNQFIDGVTYYRDYLDLYYQYAMNIFEGNTDIPPDIIEFFEIYFSGI